MNMASHRFLVCSLAGIAALLVVGAVLLTPAGRQKVKAVAKRFLVERPAEERAVAPRTMAAPMPTKNFKVMAWYESWCERPLGANGYGIPPWEIDWRGVDVIVHFDNSNVNDDAPPYWSYINKGNAFADSLYFFRGVGNENVNYVDSLIRRGHNAGSLVVMEIMAVDGSHLYNVIADSSQTDVFCTSVARWLERHDYDGVDVNWESNFQDVAHTSQFIRILRRRLNQYVRTPLFQKHPWLSLTSPPGAFVGNPFDLSVKDSVDMYCPQQGTAGATWSGYYRSNINWYGIAVRVSEPLPSPPDGPTLDAWLFSLSNDASWIPSSRTPLGMRAVEAYGIPRGKIAPAFGLGGGSVQVGNDSLYRPFTAFYGDQGRFLQKDLLTVGGRWVWDSLNQASSIRGVATGTLSRYGIVPGARFFAPTADSLNAYYAGRWLIDNGWGGVAPYSVQFDVDPSMPFAARLPGHRGLLDAKRAMHPR